MAVWQLGRRTLRRLRIGTIVVFILGFLYILPSLLISIPALQRYAARQVSQELSQLLHAPVELDRVWLDGWHMISLSGVSIRDSLGRRALHATELKAGLDLAPLLAKNELRMTSARLFGLELLIDVDSVTGRSNVQHILDALTQDSGESAALSIDLKNILVRDAALELLRSRIPHERVDSINLQVSQLSVTPDSLSGALEELSFKTLRGFRLTDLSARIHLKQGLLSVDSLRAHLPESSLSLSNLRVDLSARGLSALRLLRVEDLQLALQDLAPLVPALQDAPPRILRGTAVLNTRGRQGDLQELTLRLGDELNLVTDLSFVTDTLGALQSFDIRRQQLDLDAQALSSYTRLFAELGLPEEFLNTFAPLGATRYQGRGHYRVGQELSLSGSLTTALGSWGVRASGQLEGSRLSTLSARLATTGFDLGTLLGEASATGLMQGDLVAELTFPETRSYPKGQARLRLGRLDWKETTYQGLSATVSSLDGLNYQLSVRSDDKRLPLMVDGRASLAKSGDALSDLRLRFRGEQLRLDPFVSGLDRLSVDGSIQVDRLDPKHPQGHLELGLLRGIYRGTPIDLSHSTLALGASEEGGTRLSFTAPWATLEAEGRYDLVSLPRDLLLVLSSELPALEPLLGSPHSRPTSHLRLMATVDSIPSGLSTLIGLPLKVHERTSIKGRLDGPGRQFELEARSSALQLQGHRLTDCRVYVTESSLRLLADAQLADGTELQGIDVHLMARDNLLDLAAYWGHDTRGVEQGRLKLTAQLSAPEKLPMKSLRDLRVQLKIAPSTLRIHTALWQIAPAEVLYAGGLLRIAGLECTTEGRRLSIEGGIGSWLGSEGITARLERINLGYILGAAGVNFSLLNTDLTGIARASLEHGHLQASAEVSSPQLFVNQQDVGALDASVTFSSRDLYLHIDGGVQQTAGGYSSVTGWIKPARGAGLDLTFDADSLDVSFVGSFMTSFLSKLEGRATGRMRLHGLFAEGVTLEGDAAVARGRVGMARFGTEYTFDHTIRLKDERIDLEGLRLRDDQGHTGLLHGYVEHRYFNHFNIQLSMDELQGLKVLSTSSPRFMPIYGQAYARGRAEMRGLASALKVSVDLESEPGTDLMMDFEQMTAGQDESLMRFTNLRQSPHAVGADTLPVAAAAGGLPSTIDLHLKFNITPAARLSLRLGEDNTSLLTGRAEGALEVTVPSNGNPEVYGTLAVREGEYLLTLRQLARKRFTLRNGGVVAFRGNPSAATLQNLTAVYALTANIADLDENVSKLAGRTNIPVHCLLRLSGEVGSPNVKFDLEFPNADSEIERRVRALLNTEDAVMRQMLYLIALGKFYTSDAESRTSTTTNEWTAVASSALSEQLSSWLGSLSKQVRLGTSIKTKSTAFEDTDIELNFSGSFLNNRLTVNGHVGYHDNPYLNNQYLGEFDIEYRLNRSGSWHLKGYNHYNTMYQYLRQNLLTQGFGILYRQRFDSLKELLWPRRYRRRRLQDTLPPSTVLPDTLAQPARTAAEESGETN